MGRKLNATVMVEGVVYDAGTDETDVVGFVAEGLWDGDPGPGSVTAPTQEPSLQLILDRLGEVAAKVDLIAAASGVAEPGPGYDDWKVPDLKAEIEKRNADRDPDGDTYIKPEEPGNKPELAAALAADDEN